MASYHCEWNMRVDAESPIAAAETVVKAFSNVIHSGGYHEMTVVDEDGDMLWIPMQGTRYEDPEAPREETPLPPEPKPIVGIGLFAMAIVLALVGFAFMRFHHL